MIENFILWTVDEDVQFEGLHNIILTHKNYTTSNVIIPENNFVEVYMIDPVIFTIGNFSLRWYGVIVMIGVIVGSLLVEREIKHRGENGDRIWDALIWVLPVGILGARLWYVLNATLGGNRYYIENPIQIINIPQGGLHIYGGLLFGAITLLVFLKRNELDHWLFLDVAGPALLIGQAIGRIANFINQELYGPPTDLPWGIKIEASHRLLEYQNLNLFPVETTRFHPTFAYEMIWNFAVAGFLIWASRRYEKELKPGTLFAGWLILAGVGRIWIEFFRPDQPKIEALGISYTTVAAALMGIIGLVLLMARYKAIDLAFAKDWDDEYRISRQVKPQGEPIEVDKKSSRVKKATTVKAKTKVVKKAPARKTTSTTTKKAASKTPKKPTTRTKKSS
ncbi:MAG TPA: prolipoprotein diacylglyceryl transferase [Anaerolineae bacterium]|nr:prolipoprotein diacylglyceryl transferase [Anaerolineae bacterium]